MFERVFDFDELTVGLPVKLADLLMDHVDEPI